MSDDTRPPALACRHCGERLVRGRRTAGFSHAPRLAAACDIDADHRPEPDWARAGALPCRACGAATAPVDAAGTAFRHRDEPARDDDHAADPVLPVI